MADAAAPAAPADAGASDKRVPQRFGGTLILVGGDLNEMVKEVHDRAVKKMAKRDNADADEDTPVETSYKVGVLFITACSCSCDSSARKDYSPAHAWTNQWWQRGQLVKYGFPEENFVAIPLTLDTIDMQNDDEVVKAINQCDAFFIPKGEQYRAVLNCFKPKGPEQLREPKTCHPKQERGEPSNAYQSIINKYKSGAVVFVCGESASLVSSGPMVTGGGGSHEVLAAKDAKEDCRGAGASGGVTYDPNGGLGFLDGEGMCVHPLSLHCTHYHCHSLSLHCTHFTALTSLHSLPPLPLPLHSLITAPTTPALTIAALRGPHYTHRTLYASHYMQVCSRTRSWIRTAGREGGKGG
jgi:hypothetical protein